MAPKDVRWGAQIRYKTARGSKVIELHDFEFLAIDFVMNLDGIRGRIREVRIFPETQPKSKN